MNDEIELHIRCVDELNQGADDSLAYQNAQSALPVDDPLAAIKALRLEQLAVCRLKSEDEMQAMRDALQKK